MVVLSGSETRTQPEDWVYLLDLRASQSECLAGTSISKMPQILQRLQAGRQQVLDCCEGYTARQLDNACSGIQVRAGTSATPGPEHVSQAHKPTASPLSLSAHLGTP